MKPKGEAPLCRCGCGQTVGSYKGIWSQWRPGHNHRADNSHAPIPLIAHPDLLAESVSHHPSGATGTQLALFDQDEEIGYEGER